jgi:hypothetical protein
VASCCEYGNDPSGPTNRATFYERLSASEEDSTIPVRSYLCKEVVIKITSHRTNRSLCLLGAVCMCSKRRGPCGSQCIHTSADS